MGILLSSKVHRYGSRKSDAYGIEGFQDDKVIEGQNLCFRAFFLVLNLKW
jgi:hypothetical protein